MKNPSFRRKKESTVIKPESLPEVKGFNLSQDSVRALVKSMKHIGFQATHLSRAAEIIDQMQKEHADIYLTCTSNIVSSGLREIIAQLVQHKKIAAIITSTGAIEEDLMKTKTPFRIGTFDVNDEELKKNKLNRIGNIFVGDLQYCDFEDFHMAFLEDCYREKKIWSPSEYIRKLGLKINDEQSILFWAARNNVPIYVPGIVDGAMGDHFFFFNEKHKDDPFIIDTIKDVTVFYKQILDSKETGGIILGGGIAKHHLIGAAILRNGLDYAIYISTGTPGDGSLSGAKPQEAISWNKLKKRENSAHVEADATLVFPLLASCLLPTS